MHEVIKYRTVGDAQVYRYERGRWVDIGELPPGTQVAGHDDWLPTGEHVVRLAQVDGGATWQTPDHVIYPSICCTPEG